MSVPGASVKAKIEQLRSAQKAKGSERVKDEVKNEQTLAERLGISSSNSIKRDLSIKRDPSSVIKGQIGIKHEQSGVKSQSVKQEKLELPPSPARSCKTDKHLKREVKHEEGLSIKSEDIQNFVVNRLKAERKLKMELKKVKLERKRKTKGKRKRRRGPKRRKASEKFKMAMHKPLVLSEDLASLLGHDELSRPETMRAVWAYAKRNKLQNPKNKRQIRCDEKMKKVFGQKTLELGDIAALLSPHFDYSKEATGGAMGVAAQTKRSLHHKFKFKRMPKSEKAKKEKSEKAEPENAASKRKLETKGEDLPVKAQKVERKAQKVETKEELQPATVSNPITVKKQTLVKQQSSIGSYFKKEKRENIKKESCAEAELIGSQDNQEEPVQYHVVSMQLYRISRHSVTVKLNLSGQCKADVVLNPIVSHENGELQSDAHHAQNPCFRAQMCQVLALDQGNQSVDLVSDDEAAPVLLEASVTGLNPSTSYEVAVEIAGSEILDPHVRVLPQRDQPQLWSTAEVICFVESLPLPLLVPKIREYMVDGQTLVAFGDEDLIALGVAAPFMRKRLLTAVKAMVDKS